MPKPRVTTKEAQAVNDDIEQATKLNLTEETNLKELSRQVQVWTETVLQKNYDCMDALTALLDVLNHLRNETFMLIALEEARTLAYNIQVSQMERERK